MRVPSTFLCTNRFAKGLLEAQAGITMMGVKVWEPARPEPYYSIFERWKAAWLVFTGKADALRWVGQ